MLLYNLRMAWWNTALSPAAKKSTPKMGTADSSIICNHLKRLFTEFACDLIAICEVSFDDITYFNSNLNLTNIAILDLTCVVGKTRFDMAVLYNHEKVAVKHEYSLSRVMTGNTVKAAQLVEVENLDDNTKIKLFLCHWASRLIGDGEDRRKASANLVYSVAQEFMNKKYDVIVMGDFNDNPYNDSILENLHATRCHDAVRKFPKEYLYNPFWRTVVSSDKYSHISDLKSFRSGTYKYKQFKGTVWHSYDQIMFSGSFLGTSSWHLNEQQTKALDDAGFTLDFDDNRNIIDHLPIVCEITRP